MQKRNVVPTWNYVAVHVPGQVQLVEQPSALLDIVRHYVDHYGSVMPEPWHLDSAEPHFTESLLSAIVGFTIEIESIEGKWKVCQNHSKERRQRVIGGLQNRPGENNAQRTGLLQAMLSGQEQPKRRHPLQAGTLVRFYPVVTLEIGNCGRRQQWYTRAKHGSTHKGLSMKYRTRTLVILVLLIPVPLVACLWDSDTLEEERRQFPSVLELITGKFLRHSPAFYEWRIEDRKKRLEQEPDNVALYDDLAVAYEKTGQTDLAIETILKKEEISAGLYETYANLGTFYIHAGRLEEGLQEIKKAIEINPDAHFGREVYQKLLVEYVLSKQQDGKLKLPMFPHSKGYGAYGFGEHVMNSVRAEYRWSDDELREEGERATKGILGMMRFGNFDSPVLLESLSDLLMMRDDSAQAKQLAARALLQASYVGDSDPVADYRRKAEAVLNMQTHGEDSISEVTLEEIEAQFRDELAEASAWYEAVSSLESTWIANGQNPEIEFARYYSEPPSQSKRELPSPIPKRPPIPTVVILGGGLMLLAVLAYLRSAWTTRQRNLQETPSEIP